MHLHSLNTNGKTGSRERPDRLAQLNVKALHEQEQHARPKASGERKDYRNVQGHERRYGAMAQRQVSRGSNDCNGSRHWRRKVALKPKPLAFRDG
jgi:hypothetical protein